MSLSRCLISSAVLAGAVFCGTTLPLAALGSKPVTVQFEDKPVFVGQVQEFAGPYLGLATAISLAAGVASLATAGWRHSSRKLGQTEAQMSTLKQQLSEKEALLEDLKFSQQRLSASGLEFFLTEDDAPLPNSIAPIAPIAPAPVPADQPASAAPYVVVGAEQPQTIHPALMTLTPSQPAVTTQAATALASAQAFMSFARPAHSATAPVVAEAGTELDELLSHLKQVMTQIERMQIVPAERTHLTNATWQQRQLAS